MHSVRIFTVRDALQVLKSARSQSQVSVQRHRYFRMDGMLGAKMIYKPCRATDKGAEEHEYLVLLQTPGVELPVERVKKAALDMAITRASSGTHPLLLQAYEKYHEFGHLEESPSIMFRNGQGH